MNLAPTCLLDIDNLPNTSNSNSHLRIVINQTNRQVEVLAVCQFLEFVSKSCSLITLYASNNQMVVVGVVQIPNKSAGMMVKSGGRV